MNEMDVIEMIVRKLGEDQLRDFVYRIIVENDGFIRQYLDVGMVYEIFSGNIVDSAIIAAEICIIAQAEECEYEEFDVIAKSEARNIINKLIFTLPANSMRDWEPESKGLESWRKTQRAT